LSKMNDPPVCQLQDGRSRTSKQIGDASDKREARYRLGNSIIANVLSAFDLRAAYCILQLLR
jgi:hypothetical protein